MVIGTQLEAVPNQGTHGDMRFWLYRIEQTLVYINQLSFELKQIKAEVISALELLELPFRTWKNKIFKKKINIFNVGHNPYTIRETELEYICPFRN